MATVDQFKRSKGHTHTNSPKPTAWPAVSSFQYSGSSAWHSRRVNERANPSIKDPLLLRRMQSTHCSVDIAVRMREVLDMPGKPWELPWVVSISFPEAAILLDKSNGGSEDEIGVVLASARRRF